MATTLGLDAPYLPHLSCALSVLTSLYSLSHLNHNRNPGPHSTFLLIAISTLIAFVTSQSFTDDRWLNFVFARYQLIFLAHQSWLHLILGFDALKEERAQWWQRREGPVHETSKDRKRRGRDDPDWLFGYKMLFNPMGVGMRWDVSRSVSRANSKTPATASGKESLESRPVSLAQPGSIQSTKKSSRTKDEGKDKLAVQTVPSSIKAAPSSRVSFIAQRLGVLFCRYIALCILYDPLVFFVMPDNAPISVEDYSPARQYFVKLLLAPSLGADLTLNQYTRMLQHAFTLRAHYLLEYLTREYLTLSAYHDMLSIFFVAVGLDAPEEWPPLFGNIFKAYTVRRYWAEYWHLLIYRSFGGHISALLRQLGLSGKSSMGKAWPRLLHNGLVFAASGIMHVMVLWAQTGGQCMKCGCWAPFWWFIMMIVGFMTETVAIEGAKLAVRKNGKILKPFDGKGVPASWIWRILGYVWVASWLTFTMELVDYPDRYCGMKP